MIILGDIVIKGLTSRLLEYYFLQEYCMFMVGNNRSDVIQGINFRSKAPSYFGTCFPGQCYLITIHYGTRFWNLWHC